MVKNLFFLAKHEKYLWRNNFFWMSQWSVSGGRFFQTGSKSFSFERKQFFHVSVRTFSIINYILSCSYYSKDILLLYLSSPISKKMIWGRFAKFPFSFWHTIAGIFSITLWNYEILLKQLFHLTWVDWHKNEVIAVERILKI